MEYLFGTDEAKKRKVSPQDSHPAVTQLPATFTAPEHLTSVPQRLVGGNYDTVHLIIHSKDAEKLDDGVVYNADYTVGGPYTARFGNRTLKPHLGYKIKTHFPAGLQSGKNILSVQVQDFGFIQKSLTYPALDPSLGKMTVTSTDGGVYEFDWSTAFSGGFTVSSQGSTLIDISRATPVHVSGPGPVADITNYSWTFNSGQIFLQGPANPAVWINQVLPSRMAYTLGFSPDDQPFQVNNRYYMSPSKWRADRLLNPSLDILVRMEPFGTDQHVMENPTTQVWTQNGLRGNQLTQENIIARVKTNDYYSGVGDANPMSEAENNVIWGPPIETYMGTHSQVAFSIHDLFGYPFPTWERDWFIIVKLLVG